MSASVVSSVMNGQVHADQARPPLLEPGLLPRSDSANLSLVPATPAEWLQSQRLTVDEWRGPLTVEQYLGREKHIFSQTLTKDGKSTCWILTSTHLPLNPNGTRPILASCETISTDAYIARDGVLHRITSHGIGSVFARKEHRGRGYAGRMMAELGQRLETWQQHNGDRGQFSVLYSDIGQKFYSQYGWKAFPSTHIHLLPINQHTYQSASQLLPNVNDLTSDDLQDLPAPAVVEQDLLWHSKQQPSTNFVSIKPDLAHFQWHHAREEFILSTLGKPFPKIKGAIHKPTGIAMVWNRVFPENPKEWQLHVLHVIIPPGLKDSSEGLKALSALILRAQLEATAWDLQGGVEIWDPADVIVAAAQNLRTQANDKVEVIHRDEDHISSLRWTGPDGEDADVVWLYNQKYAWC
ncbi:hypothetical protein DV736_g1013, partial [Chaetothyriales sp. CBS 134916]